MNDVVRYEILPRTHKGYVGVQWEVRTKDKVDTFRHQFRDTISIGDVWELMSKHHASHYLG